MHSIFCSARMKSYSKDFYIVTKKERNSVLYFSSNNPGDKSIISERSCDTEVMDSENVALPWQE